MPDSYAIDADWTALYVDGEWSEAGGYNDGTIVDEVTETEWISIRREPREYPF